MAAQKNLPALQKWIPLAITLLAAALRLMLLGKKPPHFDEGVNGFFVDQITHTGFYRYDPSNFHGPMHMYVLFLFQTLLGRHIWALRLPLVMISTATVWLLTRFDRFLPPRICWLAALAMAVSPGMIFYARYAIHESELVFFLVLLTWGAAGLWTFGEKKYLWATGLSLAGMLLTKETYIIHLACFALALPCLLILERLSPSTFPPLAKQHWTLHDLGAVCLVSAVSIVFFYSGGFFDPSALNGLWQTYAQWFQKGIGGEGHEKELKQFYWLYLIYRYETPVLFGLIATPLVLWPKQSRFLRYVTIYGCGALAAYSFIKYKTPWCIISIIWPFYFLFGALIHLAWRHLNRIAAPVIAGSAICATTYLSISLNYFHYTDPNEPYVYVQTYEDINKLIQPLTTLSKLDPRNFHLSGNILVASYHPLVWMLADYPNITFYEDDKKPDEIDADIVLIEDERVEEIEPLLKGTYFTDEIQIRDGMEASHLFLSYTKFARLFPGRVPDFSPDTREHLSKDAFK